MSYYFGTRYDAPVYEDATQAATPVGEKCTHCDEEIAQGDDGFLVPWLGDAERAAPSFKPIHRECQIRGIVGSVAHLRGECHCVTGTWEGEDKYLEEFGGRRGEAKQAMKEFLERAEA